jgi:hypothetical protein
MASILASPRRRRRLIRLGIVAGVLVVVALIVAILPHQNGEPGPVGGFSAGTPQLAEDARTDPATERARTAAEAKMRPRAKLFLTDIVTRTQLSRAYGQLAPSLQEKYDRQSWLDGDGLPFGRQVGGRQSGSTVAYSGPNVVGFVLSYQPADDTERSHLYAVRYTHRNGRWGVDYVKEGQSSTYVSDREFAPAGFLPGSATTSIWWWLTIPLGFIVVIGLIAVVDNRLGRNGV